MELTSPGIAPDPGAIGAPTPGGRVSAAGKFFRHGGDKWYVKGFSYGPFAPNRAGEPFPERERLLADFAHISDLGANCVRVYVPPPSWVLDDALRCGLRVFVDIPWEKHRCFFEDWSAQERAINIVRATVEAIAHHPAVFAISVGNEIPADIVRFYGQQRVAAMIDQLIDVAKREAPECLVTYVNYPTTEFLLPTACDFQCFNVYVHDPRKLTMYLARLQHIAGDRPLVLGEYGLDTVRHREPEQAEHLAGHLRTVFGQGVAGAFIFSYTDDWHTGGHDIEDWAFGVTRRDRSEKRSAAAVRDAWRQVPFGAHADLPRVSVVVCSYNGASTIRECLRSLSELDYPDYEVILIDDGSTDDTFQIAGDYPQVVYHRQENRGLSVARNVGAELATGEIVAYTDADCVADEHWLRYLVEGMLDQGVEAIGGPNITPATDGWVARCIAASPGNPCHVMLDDRRAEHVPGCNMAFRLRTLLTVGGFDRQFRQAGDDVDICWRFLDADLPIGYAPGAMVWHKRRPTIAAYVRQQKGYGRSEAMVHLKHRQRCGPLGSLTWRGIMYCDGATGLLKDAGPVYHGRFGYGLFQTIYRSRSDGIESFAMSLEWHFLCIFLLLLSILHRPLVWVPPILWCATLVLAASSARSSALPRSAPWWSRPLIAYLHVLQPILRGWHRATHLLRRRRLPAPARPGITPAPSRSTAENCSNHFWDNRQGLGREILLEVLVAEAKERGWAGDFDNAWTNWDLTLVGDRWHDVTVRSATEELGQHHRFTRARCEARATSYSRITAVSTVVWSGAAVATWQPWAIGVGLVCGAILYVCRARSRRRCLQAVSLLVAEAARVAGLSEPGPGLAGRTEGAGRPGSSAVATDLIPRALPSRWSVRESAPGAVCRLGFPQEPLERS